MGEKDMAAKTLEGYNDVFADMVNVFLFDGEQVVREEELMPADTLSQYKADNEIHEQERDVSKIWRHIGINIALIGFENQSYPDRFMPLRVLSYDGAAYRQQLNRSKESDNTGTKNCCPVITLVLYFGSKKWSYGMSVYDCVDIPEGFKPFVNDYKMNFYAMQDMKSEQIQKFQSDFRIIAEFFGQTSQNEQTVPAFSDQVLDHPQETLNMIQVFSGDRRYLDAYNAMLGENTEGGVTMSNIYSKTLDQIAEQEIEKGRAEGRIEGIAKGVEKGKAEMIRTLMSLGRSVKEIAEFFKTDEAEINGILSVT